jgi:diguanylate cyclase
MFGTIAQNGPHSDPALVALAAAVCLVSIYLAFLFIRQAETTEGNARLRLMGSTAVLFGLGLWGASMGHALSQVAAVDLRIDPWLMALAAANAASTSGVGIGITIYSGTFTARLLGGLFFGTAAAGTHHAVISALKDPVAIEVNSLLAGLTFPTAAALGMAGFVIAFGGHALWRYAVGGLLLAASVGATEMLGRLATELVARPDISGIGISADRTSFSFVLALSVVLIPIGIALSGYLGRSVHRRHEREAERLRMLANITSEGISIHSDGAVVDVNEAYARMVGRTVEECVGRAVRTWIAPEHIHIAQRNFEEGSTAPYEIDFLRPDGSRVPVEIYGRFIEYRGKQVRACVVRDITIRKRTEEQIRYLAHHDALTGLPNRILFHDRLEQTLIRARRQGEEFAVLCLDLDGFKNVNDLRGHATGDTLLYEVAACLTHQISSTATLARIGGDEFAIIQPACGRPDEVADLAEKLLNVFNHAFGPHGHNFDVTLSVGIALFPNDADEAEKLMKRAIIALRRAQDDGGGRYRFFEAAMDERLRMRQRIEADLRIAIAQDQLMVHYQAQADVVTGNIVGFEALARWKHPERGMIPPADFIPVAEECGLIGEIGEWVLRRACADAAQWPRHLRVGVNLSAKQFTSGDIVSVVEDVLRVTDLAPSRLELEITESVLIDDGNSALVILLKLKSLGVRIAMDDFGTGYSSLSYLQTFPFDKIKVDRSFVTGVDQNRGSLAIIRAVIGLGTALGLSVIAEGVETEAELEVLRREKCAEVQGYLLSRPVPVEELPEVMTRQLRRVAGEMRSGNPEAKDGHGRFKVV